MLQFLRLSKTHGAKFGVFDSNFSILHYFIFTFVMQNFFCKGHAQYCLLVAVIFQPLKHSTFHLFTLGLTDTSRSNISKVSMVSVLICAQTRNAESVISRSILTQLDTESYTAGSILCQSIAGNFCHQLLEPSILDQVLNVIFKHFTYFLYLFFKVF